MSEHHLQDGTAEAAGPRSGSAAAPLRVLYVIDSYAAGGAESSLLQMVPYWIDAGSEVHIATLHDRGDLKTDFALSGASLHSGLGLRRTGYRNVSRLIRTIRPDVVHTTLFESDLVGQLAAARHRVPSLTTWATMSYVGRTSFRDVLDHPRLAAARGADMISAGLASEVHAVSESVAAWNGRQFRRRRGVNVIARGRPAGLATMMDATSSAEVREELGLTTGQPLLICIARSERSKGIDTVLEALAILRAARPAELLVVGRDGNDSKRLQRLTGELGLQDGVHFLGVRSDVLRLLAASDVMVSGTTLEGLPGVVIEAMAIGVPVIATDIAPMREAMGGNRRLVPPGDSSALAAALARQLDGGFPDDRVVLQARFLEHFTLDSVAARMRELHLEVATTPKLRRRWAP